MPGLATDNDTLEMLDDVARSLASFDPDRLRRIRDDGGTPDRVMWTRFADAGWLSILVPEADGGAGLAVDACTVVARRLGYAASLDPFVASGVLASAVLAWSGHPDRSRWLDALGSGQTLFGVAWQPDRVLASTHGAQPVLTGRSRFLGVAGADYYLVGATTDAGPGIFGVARGDRLTERHERCADGSCWADLAFDAAVAETFIDPEEGSALIGEALDLARVVCAAELLGVMDRALELTLEYLRDRRQFGVPIGTFQVLQHRAVDAWMQRQLAEAALNAAIKTHLDPAAGLDARAAAASSVKARASEAAPAVCATALQLHGAIGFTDEYDLGFYLNRALTLSPWLGTAAEHRRRFIEIESRQL